MNLNTWPALITLLDIGLLMWTAAMCGRARVKYGVAAPAVSGDPMFERYFRVQMNTVENSVLFLPALWLASLYASWYLVVLGGFTWVVGRVIYALGYLRAPEARSTGFAISILGFFVLLTCALIGVVRSLAGI